MGLRHATWRGPGREGGGTGTGNGNGNGRGGEGGRSRWGCQGSAAVASVQRLAGRRPSRRASHHDRGDGTRCRSCRPALPFPALPCPAWSLAGASSTTAMPPHTHTPPTHPAECGIQVQPLVWLCAPQQDVQRAKPHLPRTLPAPPWPRPWPCLELDGLQPRQQHQQRPQRAGALGVQLLRVHALRVGGQQVVVPVRVLGGEPRPAPDAKGVMCAPLYV